MHDLLANHRDIQASHSLPVEQIAASGFHCHIDDLVVVAPFIPDMESTDPMTLLSAPLHYAEPVNSFVSLFLSYTDGRGPPADFCS